jgi:hypothetical protein
MSCTATIFWKKIAILMKTAKLFLKKIEKKSINIVACERQKLYKNA